jgi:alpha-ketoglutarate-dependent taurine dioxygenase
VVFSQTIRTWFFDVEPEKVLKVYEAIKVFLDYCYKPENLLKTKLETGNFRKNIYRNYSLGDTVLWANTRVLHARTEYKITPGSPVRCLNGCYFKWDYVKSKIREIRDKLQLPENIVSF